MRHRIGEQGNRKESGEDGDDERKEQVLRGVRSGILEKKGGVLRCGGERGLSRYAPRLRSRGGKDRSQGTRERVGRRERKGDGEKEKATERMERW
eukprot:177712-Pleurochrysis_carterae.AAC.1